MREILFRGKRLDNGEWVCGFYVHHRNATHYILDIMHGGYEDISGGFFVPRWYRVDPTTVGQYTGLKAHGKRIFEGDIISFNDGVDYFKGEVVFENGAFGIGSDAVIGSPYSCCDNFVLLWQLLWEQDATDEPELYYCTVAGNIHDNPELLEVRQ